MNGFYRGKIAGNVYPVTVFLITNLPFKVPLPDDDVLGPESEDDDNELFSSMTVPSVIKTVVRNGNTLVYHVELCHVGSGHVLHNLSLYSYDVLLLTPQCFQYE